MARSISRTVMSGTLSAVAITALSFVVSPAAHATVSCTNQVKSFVPGVYAYWGRCTGTPVGTSRDYKYREVVTCPTFPGPAYTSYGPWKYFGEWSKVSCNGADKAISHKVVMVYI
jgi:hypothetical protein